MAKQCFKEWVPKPATIQLLAQCIAITEEYMEHNLKSPTKSGCSRR